MAHIISVINNKGGTGKTTTVHNLGAALALKKKKVLLLDLDSQSNLSSALGINGKEPSFCDLITNAAKIDETIIETGNMHGIPSSDKLLENELLLNNEPGREYILKEMIDQVANRYDYILIDCPPSMGTLSINSLVAAHSFIVPMQAENFAFIGLDRIMAISGKVKKRMNPTLELEGILFVKLSPRTKFSQAVISQLSGDENFTGRLFNTFIRQDINLMESGAFHQTVFDYAPKSHGAEDYKDLANEILKKHGKK